ncbi:MAG TPA: DUF2911 domain-containing protein [Terriglobales bacterium]|nr:DUF2911 domain-containing protein [Terriglobales bacterium]
MRTIRIVAIVFALAAFVFAQQDKSKRPSPPGTAQVTLNGKNITIDYSRPHTHDPKTHEQRKMIGGTEPYGKPWRAGANEATTLKTQADLDIGGTSVPAGTYTLYALPEEGKMTLIISKKTGQWGIPYPGEQDDLARIPMQFNGNTGKDTEQFTISFAKKGNDSADMHFTWENWDASVNIKAK